MLHCQATQMHKVISFNFTLFVCLILTTFACAETLVVLLEGLGGRVTSSGIVSLQEELSAIPKTIVALPLAQHNWRDAVKLIKQQKNHKPKLFCLAIAWEQITRLT